MASSSINVVVRVRWPYLWYALQLVGASSFANWMCIKCEVDRG